MLVWSFCCYAEKLLLVVFSFFFFFGWFVDSWSSLQFFFFNSDFQVFILNKPYSMCRDEIHRLIEIIHSRAVDLPEQEKKYSTTIAKGDAERPMVALENPRNSIEEKQEDLSKTPWGTSTAPLQSSVSRVTCSDNLSLMTYAWISTLFCMVNLEKLLNCLMSHSLLNGYFSDISRWIWHKKIPFLESYVMVTINFFIFCYFAHKYLAYLILNVEFEIEWVHQNVTSCK